MTPEQISELVSDGQVPPCCIPSLDASEAEIAYCAYNASGDPATAGLNYAGLPSPTWRDLPENVRAKWRGALAGLAAHRDTFSPSP